MRTMGGANTCAILLSVLAVLKAVRHDDVNLMVNELTAESDEDSNADVNGAKQNVNAHKHTVNATAALSYSRVMMKATRRYSVREEKSWPTVDILSYEAGDHIRVSTDHGVNKRTGVHFVAGVNQRTGEYGWFNIAHATPAHGSLLESKTKIQCENSFFSDWGSSGMKLLKVHYGDAQDGFSTPDTGADGKNPIYPDGGIERKIKADETTVAFAGQNVKAEMGAMKTFIRQECAKLRKWDIAHAAPTSIAYDGVGLLDAKKRNRGWVLFATAGLRLIAPDAEDLWKAMAQLNEEELAVAESDIKDDGTTVGSCNNLMFQCRTSVGEEPRSECQTIPGAREATYEFKAFMNLAAVTEDLMKQDKVGWIGAGGASLQIGFYGTELNGFLDQPQNAGNGGLKYCLKKLNDIVVAENWEGMSTLDEQEGKMIKAIGMADAGEGHPNGNRVFLFSFLSSAAVIYAGSPACHTTKGVVTIQLRDTEDVTHDTFAALVNNMAKTMPLLFYNWHWNNDGSDKYMIILDTPIGGLGEAEIRRQFQAALHNEADFKFSGAGPEPPMVSGIIKMEDKVFCNHMVGGINQMRQAFELWWNIWGWKDFHVNGKFILDNTDKAGAWGPMANPCLEQDIDSTFLAQNIEFTKVTDGKKTGAVVKQVKSAEIKDPDGAKVTGVFTNGPDTISLGTPGALTMDTVPNCKLAVNEFLMSDLSVQTWVKENCFNVPSTVDLWGMMTAYGRAYKWVDGFAEQEEKNFCFTGEVYKAEANWAGNMFQCGNVWTYTMLNELHKILTNRYMMETSWQMKADVDWAKSAMTAFNMKPGWCSADDKL